MKRTRATSRQSRFWDFPDHIIMDILTRLPLKTILNCRCVCTSWRNIISDPHFTKLHLSVSPAVLMFPIKSYENLYVVVDSVEAYSIGVGGLNDDVVRVPDNAFLKFNPKFDIPDLQVLSSCNGLICLYEPRTYNPYYICNPMMSEYVVVPQIKKDLFVLAGSGFGFSPKTNQFKVLRFSLPLPKTGLPSLKLETEINTLGTNLWRQVGNPPSYLHWFSCGCFLNGGLHWIVHDPDNHFKSVCVFDFGEEQFWPFPGPSQLVANHNETVNRMNMDLLGGCLAIYHYSSDHQFDIWLMKDYGVKESWTKEFVIETTNKSYFYQPIMLLNNGEILMLFAFTLLVSYNTTYRSSRSVKINVVGRDFKALRDFKAKAYIPSFVSIKDIVKGETLKEALILPWSQ
uniref:Putative F-box and associated interaction domains-containing protein isoform 1 n=1 Tax=Davidia involucrata TaxID=16924 RepID=A0A5B7BCA3_DAVIN